MSEAPSLTTLVAPSIQRRMASWLYEGVLLFGVVFISGVVFFVLLYLFGFLYFLWDKLGVMKIPVIIYALVISTMLLVAIKGYFTWNSKSGKLLLIGAVFFVLSDSILAINKFYVPIYLSSFWIMSTYITAQFLIVKGVLNLNSKQ